MTTPLNFSGLLESADHQTQQAKALAAAFEFKIINAVPKNSFYLQFKQERLELLQSGTNAPGAISIEYTTGKLAHRLKFGGGRGQPLARAVGMKSGFNPTIVDATAGLGRDGFILASLGSQVTLCERSAILAALLQNGIHRAMEDVEIGGWVTDRINLIHVDSAEYLLTLNDAQKPDVVYVDPMYPDKKSSALVKKEILALQQLLGPDMDSLPLFQNALKIAKRRVVVKRPKQADWLHNEKPNTAIESKNTRYDIYITL